MQFDPNDLIELMKVVEEYKEVIKIFGELLNAMVPETMEALAPTVGHLLTGTAGADWHYYRALIDAGFTEQQAFTLLLNFKTRIEEYTKTPQNNINTDKQIRVRIGNTEDNL